MDSDAVALLNKAYLTLLIAENQRIITTFAS